MVNPVKLSLIITILIVATAPLNARLSRAWSYAQLREASDLVVLAKPVSNTATKDIFNKEESEYQGIDTEFEVIDIVKGAIVAKIFKVLHFALKPGGGDADGMSVVSFRLKPLTLDVLTKPEQSEHRAGTRALIQLTAPEYLLFLKKRSDGRYEPVTGQMDASISVLEVSDPFPLTDED